MSDNERSAADSHKDAGNMNEKHTPLPWQSDYAGNMITDCVPSCGYTFDKIVARFNNWADVPFVLERVNNYDSLKEQLAAKEAEIDKLKRVAFQSQEMAKEQLQKREELEKEAGLWMNKAHTFDIERQQQSVAIAQKDALIKEMKEALIKCQHCCHWLDSEGKLVDPSAGEK